MILLSLWFITTSATPVLSQILILGESLWAVRELQFVCILLHNWSKQSDMLYLRIFTAAATEISQIYILPQSYASSCPIKTSQVYSATVTEAQALSVHC